jgi:hypothetical protein
MFTSGQQRSRVDTAGSLAFNRSDVFTLEILDLAWNEWWLEVCTLFPESVNSLHKRLSEIMSED